MDISFSQPDFHVQPYLNIHLSAPRGYHLGMGPLLRARLHVKAVIDSVQSITIAMMESIRSS